MYMPDRANLHAFLLIMYINKYTLAIFTEDAYISLFVETIKNQTVIRFVIVNRIVEKKIIMYTFLVLILALMQALYYVIHTLLINSGSLHPFHV